MCLTKFEVCLTFRARAFQRALVAQRRYHRLRHISNVGQRREETIQLRVGGNGHVNLSVSSPVQLPQKNSILVYLPPGPGLSQRPSSVELEHSQTASSTEIEHLVKRFSESTVISINYRLGPWKLRADHRFPTPIHDVFRAYDYIVDPKSAHNAVFLEHYQKRMARDSQLEPGLSSSPDEPTICLYGSHIGGALALSLALTNPNEICAVALQDPLVDWAVLDELIEIPSPSSSSESSSISRRSSSTNTRSKTGFENLQARAEAAKALIKLRTALFRAPSGYFDSFASPTLFLRAPGRDTPLARTTALEAEEREAGSNVSEFRAIRYGENDDDVGWVEYNQDAFGPYDDDYHAAADIHSYSHSPTTIQMSTGNGPTDSGSFNEQGLSLQTDKEFPEPCFEPTTDQHVSDLADSQLDTTSMPNADFPVTEFHSDAANPPSAPARRRKVLRRWPPNLPPEAVMLPHINIFLTEPGTVVSDDGSDTSSSSFPAPEARKAETEGVSPEVQETGGEKRTLEVDLRLITHLQGTELCGLLRRACFWGRDSGFAEERVTLTPTTTRPRRSHQHLHPHVRQHPASDPHPHLSLDTRSGINVVDDQSQTLHQDRGGRTKKEKTLREVLSLRQSRNESNDPNSDAHDEVVLRWIQERFRARERDEY